VPRPHECGHYELKAASLATVSADLHRQPAAGVDAAPALSVLVPIFNEARSLDALLRRVLDSPYPGKQIIVVDDGSTDATPDLLRHWAGQPGLTLLRHDRNLGKGAAVRTALAHARGEVTIIQDADLEYDPAEYPRLVEPILRGRAEVVYGSRYLAPARPLPWTKFRVAVLLLNGLVRLLYGRRITDEATCYKAFRTSLLRSLDLQANRFELCPEVTAKVCRLGLPIVEVPISYHPRGSKEGKKIRWRDGWQAIWTLIQWRVRPLGCCSRTIARAK
jgi:dolichol-phosphate mannosyltransferase